MLPTVKQWMSGSPVTVAPEASALEAHEAMVAHGIRHLPVVSGSEVVGILSLDDLRAGLPVEMGERAPVPAQQRDTVREWSVSDLMTPAPETLSAEASLQEAADRMADLKIGCLPVVDPKDGLQGILSEVDVLRALAATLQTEKARGGDSG